MASISQPVTRANDRQQQLGTIFSSCPLVPVITIQDPDTAVELGRALVAGGLRILEITLRTEHGLGAITALREALPDVWVGAGTITTVDQYQAAVKAGAQFAITPGSTQALLQYGTTATAPLLPGVATLSEILQAYELGYRDFKLFPAEVAGGTAALKSFAGPLPDIRFCPTGGIKPETAADYLALDNVIAVGGTWLTPQDAVSARDWTRISQIAEDSLRRCRGAG
ncbi:bifunctional 4-hydroxy-2-oxoglutarate aldolase/2-dehydro-3-deoxy-phosphogluconate aldolase [Hydrocarboniclastica marina]|uniref:bifunctional 4-hydroxy-2-oxoglutarate aldolase/2-dehydro-3-deoxy-phosphogluconate aldolase n=1 Tax=Hydrocarboniclastica marina TaxID=2259620 RepID=UPI001562CC3A|nr:bifunctional 4-hydroxy-2-oxoglutarate aldolase/2-dehydro-3-deoxy-phosphogluconate aldolase [Hydrocarboniclastica marina]